MGIFFLGIIIIIIIIITSIDIIALEQGDAASSITNDFWDFLTVYLDPNGMN
jgi:hypothetical protein